MENPIEIKADIVQIEGDKLDSRYTKLWIWALVLFLLSFIALFFCFRWKRPFFNYEVPINNEIWGQFGDFFGGVIGTIVTFVSIVFLYKAFKEQYIANLVARKAKKESQETAKQQLFDSQFNTLLSLYNDSISTYSSQPNESPNTNKARMSKLVADFIKEMHFMNQENYIKRTGKASNKFDEFFANYRTAANAHMKTLYQIFYLLESYNIDEKDKVLYVKLLRSQMTDEELILIRYNCLTKRGQKMQRPVFHYNILKHLPFLGLFEFKKYKQGLSSSQINLLNDELISWKKEIAVLFSTQSVGGKSFSNDYGKCYKLKIDISNDNTKYTFSMTKTARIQGRHTDPFTKIFDKYTDVDLENLLIDFHTELFKISHFKVYNREKSFCLTHERISSGTEVNFKINIQQKNSLIISYSQIKDPSQNPVQIEASSIIASC